MKSSIKWFFVLTLILSFYGFQTNSSVALSILNSEIDFRNDSFDSVLEDANKLDKLIFIDAYTSWCGPCKMMDRKTFSKSKIGKYFNAEFINYKIDIEKHPDGERLTKKYRIHQIPTLLLIDSKGNVVMKMVGYKSASELLSIIKEVKKKKP